MLLGEAQQLAVGPTAITRSFLGRDAVWRSPASRGDRPLTINGGGWVTGLSVGPDTTYARTDVGGAYRWDTELDRWCQLLTTESVPLGSRNPSDYQVESIAAAPSRAGTVFLTSGSGADGRILRSYDGGRHWTRLPLQFFASGNAPERVSGARLCVDPDHPTVVYLGTRCDGLWRSSDSGDTWLRLNNLPPAASDGSGHDAVGVSCVAVDARSAAIGGAHAGLWAAVYGVGLLRSDDAGATWRTVAGWTLPGGYVRDLVQVSSGHLFAAFYAPGSSNGRVRRVDPDGNVRDISPKGQAWTSLAADPSRPDVVYVAPDVITKYHSFYRTSNARSATPTWSAMTSFSFSDSDEKGSWLSDQVMPTNDPAMWVGQLRFDAKGLVLAEGRGMWRCRPPQGETIDMVNESAGIEQMVANRVLRPPGHAPLTCQWDYGLMAHDGEARLPYRTSFGSGWDLAVSPTDPNFLTVLLDDHQDLRGSSYPERRASGYSVDGGSSVQRFGALARGTAPADMLFGNHAISAHRSANIVWLPSNLTGTASRIYATDDLGETWLPGVIRGLTGDDVLHPRYTYARRVLVAHPRNPGVFYILGHLASSGRPTMWVSTDGGRTWDRSPTYGLWGSFRYNSTLKHDGTRFWAVAGDDGPAPFHSTDGVTWKSTSGLTSAQGISPGAALEGDDIAAVYTFASSASGRGIHRSRDGGGTWSRVSAEPGALYVGIRDLEADPVIPGRIYVAMAEGLGFRQLDVD